MNNFTILSDYSSAIPYYGGKSKIVRRYTTPRYDRIVEPFAGGACYSLRHYRHDVWLNDLYRPTAAVWRFLTSGDRALALLDCLPYDVKAGTPILDLVRKDDPEDFTWFVRAHLAQGAFGMPGTRNRVSPFGAKAWSSAANGGGGLRDKCEYWIPKLRHWRVTQLPYDQLPNQKATWFIDAPYNNAAGRKYAKSAKDINFATFSEWCRSREGHSIVCENNDATWLPFQPLTHKRNGIYCAGVTSTMGEAVYEQGGEIECPFDAYECAG